MDKKMLIVNNLIEGGGVEKLMQQYVTYFSTKYQVYLLVDEKPGEYKKMFPDSMKWYHFYPNNFFANVKGLRRIGKRYIQVYQFMLKFI